ncbi:hypothetical protein OG747_45055 [Streptomyces sp. NBC_01384]|uniref:hypothetical protein n=1 Tax=Streptomyces sp. NBC_01384 TaxID=2903847 RepID=UPI0032545283
MAGQAPRPRLEELDAAFTDLALTQAALGKSPVAPTAPESFRTRARSGVATSVATPGPAQNGAHSR